MYRGLPAYLIGFICSTTVWAQAEPIALTLHPKAPPARALQYHFLPEQFEVTPGDAAPIYKRVIEVMGKVPADTVEQMREWADMPRDTFPRNDVRKFLEPRKEMFRLLEQGARCDRCDFGFAERLRKAGINATLPELQEMRNLVLFLSLRLRLEIGEGKWDDAVRTIQTGLAMARHTGESPTLIAYLVGVSMTAMMLKQVDEFIQYPEAPNLYWALTDLPKPFLDIRPAFYGEQLGVYGTFPGIADAIGNPKAGPLSPKQVQDCVEALGSLMTDVFKFKSEILLGVAIRTKHETAQHALIAQGRPREMVEKMPHVQVALLHALSQLDLLSDDMRKWHSLPYWEAAPYYRDFPNRLREVTRNSTDAPALPLARYLIPAMDRVFAARARLDRKIAALRCLEAIRLHTTHSAKLPASLALIKDVPIPVDPMTGKLFEYHLSAEMATLVGAPPADEKANPGNWLTYEIVLKR
jgi:hypothetical protein